MVEAAQELPAVQQPEVVMVVVVAVVLLGIVGPLAVEAVQVKALVVLLDIMHLLIVKAKEELVLKAVMVVAEAT